MVCVVFGFAAAWVVVEEDEAAPHHVNADALPAAGDRPAAEVEGHRTGGGDQEAIGGASLRRLLVRGPEYARGDEVVTARARDALRHAGRY